MSQRPMGPKRGIPKEKNIAKTEGNRRRKRGKTQPALPLRRCALLSNPGHLTGTRFAKRLRGRTWEGTRARLHEERGRTLYTSVLRFWRGLHECKARKGRFNLREISKPCALNARRWKTIIQRAGAKQERAIRRKLTRKETLRGQEGKKRGTIESVRHSVTGDRQRRLGDSRGRARIYIVPQGGTPRGKPQLRRNRRKGPRGYAYKGILRKRELQTGHQRWDLEAEKNLSQLRSRTMNSKTSPVRKNERKGKTPYPKMGGQ